MMLTSVWAVLISFVVIMYVLLDGFDLGIGILFPLVKDHHQRDIMMSTVAPVWDGNETWMVLGAASLYGAFPLAYSILLPTIYMPIMIMLTALIFRGVAFEFRFKAQRSKAFWDFAFIAGSTVAAFMQGLIVGTFVNGYPAHQNMLAPLPYQWLTPFTVMTGVAVVVGYALLGATWLIIKTTDQLQLQMYRIAKYCLLGVALFMLVVSLWTPFHETAIYDRWFSLPNLFYLLPLPIITLIVFIWAWLALRQQREYLPFYLSICLFIFAYIGFGISSWPYIVPRVITVYQAAAPASSQWFMLVGMIILLPILLIYTFYSYRIFRGKVISGGDHY